MANEKKIAKIFNPARKSNNEYIRALDENDSFFKEAWLRSYFFFQGDLNYGEGGEDLSFIWKLIARPYLAALGRIAETTNNDCNRKSPTTDCKNIKAYIGANDYLMPLIPLTLLCVTAARLMHIKCMDLQGEGKIKSYRALKAAQVAFNIVVNVPLFVVTMPLCFVWDLVKAALSVIEATIAACVISGRQSYMERRAEKQMLSL